ncbi:MAG: carboxylating nicotinate-nucleotide diphosphorylase [Candidatus Syntropharchaeia archaeon]
MMLKEIEEFLEEDLGCDFEIFPDMHARGRIIAKEEGILAGLEEALQIFRYLGLKTSSDFADGDEIKSGDVVMEVEGSAPLILKSERLVLNFLGRMSGIATLTNKFVRISKVKIAGTRKTTPGFRKYEKKAIVIGGGDPHRFNLSDTVMIKDNHIRVYGIERAIEFAKRASFTKKIEIEINNLKDAILAAKEGVDIIMLDNMDPEGIKEVIKELEKQGLRKRVIIEASGEITLENLPSFASTGVDVISVGAITHSSKWLNFSLDMFK